jgi:TIGR00376: putative DNA helicase
MHFLQALPTPHHHQYGRRFQGQERDVILISLVRANEEGQIGFLNDLRRMNVAITRARMKLIILGDASTLTKHPFYKKLYEYILALQE